MIIVYKDSVAVACYDSMSPCRAIAAVISDSIPSSNFKKVAEDCIKKTYADVNYRGNTYSAEVFED